MAGGARRGAALGRRSHRARRRRAARVPTRGVIRTVLDPNELVSALIAPQGVSGRVVGALAEGRYQLVLSERLIAELLGVLGRQTFRRYLTAEQAISYVRDVRRLGVMAVEGDVATVSPDPYDDYLVALAHASGVEYLVSGDPHLLGLADVFPVLSPRALLAILDRDRSSPGGGAVE